MIGGGNPDPGELSLELRSAADDSARIRVYADPASTGMEIYNSSNQIASRLSDTRLELNENVGPTEIPPIGSRYRDNALVAWGRQSSMALWKLAIIQYDGMGKIKTVKSLRPVYIIVDYWPVTRPLPKKWLC